MKKKVFVLLVCGMMFLEQMAVFANGRSDANIQTEILESHQIVQIQEEVRQTVRDEEKYIDRFIVKYIDGKKKDSVEVKSASKKAYERAKKEKTKLRAALESKLENAELQEQNIFTEMMGVEENLQKKAN